MNDKLQERVFQQEEPMRCNEMLTNGQLHTHFSIQDFFKNKKSESSVIFIDHPSLSMGDVIPLINLWKNDQKNTLIWISKFFNLLNNWLILFIDNINIIIKNINIYKLIIIKKTDNKLI